MEHILEVKHLTKTFQKGKQSFTAVDDVSFHVDKGECVGLVGESGCGKSTIAKIISRLTDATDGQVFLDGTDVTRCKGKARRDYYKKMQMVFQSVTDSFNPRLKIGSSIADVLRNNGMSRSEAKRRTLELLDLVGLKRAYAERYPHQISGGECQRASIARALAVNPRLLLCDEATSALDVSVQAQIVGLIQELQEKLEMSYLFICHDLALVQNICNRVIVMHRGTIVEAGATEEVIGNPCHPYTKLLLSSIFPIDPTTPWELPKLQQQTEPEGVGCKFRERCSHCTERCKQEQPGYVTVKRNRENQNLEHDVACFLYHKA